MPNIRVLSGGGFVEQSVSSVTVGELREELNIDTRAAVSVNGRNSRNSQELNDDDMIAAVSNNKTGGDKRS